jgi:hypothetical protein
MLPERIKTYNLISSLFKHREQRARRINMRRSKQTEQLLYRTGVYREVYSRFYDGFRALQPGSPEVVILLGENKEN